MEVECISVQVKVGQQELLVVCGYRPQENAGLAKKERFWQYLEREVEEDSREEKMLLIQMDSNSWLGKKIIPRDRNIIPNSNRKCLLGFFRETQTFL